MKTTIFYENSFGIIVKWEGNVLKTTTESIVIQFSKNKASSYKFSNTDFILVTKTKLKNTNFFDVNNQISFDEATRENILNNVDSNNIAFQWNGQNVLVNN